MSTSLLKRIEEQPQTSVWKGPENFEGTLRTLIEGKFEDINLVTPITTYHFPKQIEVYGINETPTDCRNPSLVKRRTYEYYGSNISSFN